MKINSYKGAYEVRFAEDFAGALSAELRDEDVLIVDDNVRRLYAERLQALLNRHRHYILESSEARKSYRGVEDVIGRLINDGFKKNHRLVAIGGGIIQDITSFTASILYRGVQWFFVPTNLLAQCDSCIGSKTSINFGAYKNQLGGFYPPALVLIDVSLLQTLPQREVRSGLGEMLHYFLISGRSDFDLVVRLYDKAFVDLAVLQTLIRRSLEIKRTMVELDEFDCGPRNIFNYGHSFGHAIESYTQYAIPHGIAVSFGMDMANQLSVKLGFLEHAEAGEMRALLRKNWLPDTISIKNADAFLDALRKDKKNIDRDIRVILTKGMGNMFLTRVAVDHAFCGTLQDCFDYYANPS